MQAKDPKYLENSFSFWRGFLSVFNLFGSLNYHYPYKTDNDAFLEDWQMLGKDLEEAKSLFRKDHQ